MLARFILETDHPASKNTGRTMRRAIGVSCGSSSVAVFADSSFVDYNFCVVLVDSSCSARIIYTQRRITRLDVLSTIGLSHKTDYRDSSCGWMIRLLAPRYLYADGLSDELQFFAQARPRRMIRLQYKYGH